MKSIYFLAFISLMIFACTNEKVADQSTETINPDSTVITTEKITQLPIQKDLLEVQEKLQQRLTELKVEMDSVEVEAQADLQGKIRKLEAREKQLKQHLRKFEDGMTGEAEELEKRFNKLIEDVEADLKLVEEKDQ